MSLEFPPIYLLKAHFEKAPEELQRLEEEIGVVWNVKEAKYVLGKLRNKGRASLELFKLGWRTEDVNEENEGDYSQEGSSRPRKRQKLDRFDGKDVITLDSDIESETEDDSPTTKKASASTNRSSSHTPKAAGKPASDGSTIKILHLDWYTDSLKAGRLLPIKKYFVYEGRVVGPSEATLTESKATALPSKKKPLARDDKPPTLSKKSFNRSLNKHSRQRSQGHTSQGSHSFTRPASLRPEDTEEYEGIVNLPPIPDYLGTRFSCQRPTPLHCPNEAFLSQLRIIKKARTLKGDKIGIRSYSAAIATLASYPYTLTSRFEVANLPCCGPKIATIWQLWYDKGRIPEVEEVEADEQVRIMAIFYDIHGVADKTAREFFNKGWRDLDDIVELGVSISL
jgi:DNA polymerase IV